MGCLSWIIGAVVFYVVGEASRNGWAAALAALGSVALVYWIGEAIRSRSPGTRVDPAPPPPPTVVRTQWPVGRFKDVQPKVGFQTSSDLEGLNDAYTGEPLKPELGIYQCATCQVYYHRSSVEFLRTNNSGLCNSCRSSNIAPRSEAVSKESGRNYDPEVVTLSSYQHSVNRVVTFEGRAVDIRKIGRRKSSYAIMFENEAWRDGFKMVVWDRHISAVGGDAFIRSLRNKKITVRGLVQNDPTLGYQIILDRRSMILDVK